MRQRRLDGTSFEPRKLLENAHAVPTGGSPTIMTPVLAEGRGRVHVADCRNSDARGGAVLGCILLSTLTKRNNIIGASTFTPEPILPASVAYFRCSTAVFDIDFVKLGPNDFFIIDNMKITIPFGNV
jgi:hypothetical protein